MRSVKELTFRARQELANLRLALVPPAIDMDPGPGPALPDPLPVAERLRGSRFARDVVRIADGILEHRIPVAGTTVEPGPTIAWRRDHRSGITSDLRYFRRVPYLDAQRVGDHKLIWDLNRHQHLIVLAQACLFTGRDAYRQEVEAQLESWRADNPYMRGINWTSALEVAFRALSWIWVDRLLGTALAPAVRRALFAGLYRHGLFLENNLSVYFSPNTHLLGEAVVLHAIGCLVPQLPPAQRWRKLAGRLVTQQMADQVREDGSHFEQSTYYHLYALDLFLFHALLTDPTDEYRTKLRRMADYLDALMGPSRRLPLMGDEDGGRVFHPYGECDQFGRATLATCSLFFKDAKWVYGEDDLHAQAAWWLGDRALGGPAPTAVRDAESRLFPDSGIGIMNAGPVQVIIDGGSFGRGSGGHSHSDSLSIVVRNGSQDVLIDPGTFTYVSDPDMRAWFRGSVAHNLVRVDGLDQASPAGPFKWTDRPQVTVAQWSSRADHDFMEARCRAINGPVLELRRRVLLIKPRGPASRVVVAICDSIEGGSGSHDIEQLWHPGEPVTRLAPGHILVGEGGHLLIPDGCRLETFDGWRSRSFAEKSSATVFAARRRVTLPTVLWAAIVMGGVSTDPLPERMSATDHDATISWQDGSTVVVQVEESGGLSFREARPTSRAEG